MVALKVAKIGDELAVILTPELRETLGVADGGTLYAEQSETGEVLLISQDDSFEIRRSRGRAFIKRYQKTFDALAK
jgi:hypothetical protein